jgi:AraC-like DNA-binding protein
MEGGDVLVSQPGQKHSTGDSPMERATLYWLLVTLDAEEGRFLGHEPVEGRKLIDGLAALGTRKFRGTPVLHRCLDDIFAAYFDAGPCRNTLVRVLATEFLIRVIELAGRPTRSELSPAILAALGYVHEHIDQNINLEYLAESSSMSLSHFKQRFRKEVGLPPREYILRQKIDRAGEMLTSGMRITDIAHELGFSSSQYFATVFRRYSGVSPTKYRST